MIWELKDDILLNINQTNLLFIGLIFRMRFTLRFFTFFLWSTWSIFRWVGPTFGSTFWCFCRLTRTCLKANIFHYIVKPLTKMFCLNTPFRESFENFMMLAWWFQSHCQEYDHRNALRCKKCYHTFNHFNTYHFPKLELWAAFIRLQPRNNLYRIKGRTDKWSPTVANYRK